MSGHSKWSTIKRKKGTLDAKRGQLFTKLGRAISIAAREGGGDPDMNFSLRMAIETARNASMPADNIERARKRGAGELEGVGTLERAVYGGYGPSGVAFAVDVFTDNKNRTVSDLRKIFDSHGGNLADASSVLWQFKEKGLIVAKCVKLEKSEKHGEEDIEASVDPETVMMEIIEIEEVEEVDEFEGDNSDAGSKKGVKMCEVLTMVKNLAQVRGAIEKLGYIVVSAEIIKIPEQLQHVTSDDQKKVEVLIEALEEHDDVENVWTIMKAGDD